MKGKKRWFSMLLIVCMLSIITACSSPETEKNESSQTTEQTGQDTKEEKQENEETENKEEQEVKAEDEENESQGLEFESNDITIENEGRNIPATFVVPSGEGKYPLVVMHHGFAGSRQEAGGFEKIAEALAKEGIASIRLDFAGCGDSKEPYTEYNFTNNKSDSKACLNYALENEKIDKEKLGILGYSMGGRISILLTQEENPYKAMALLAPAAFTSETNAIAEAKDNLKKAEKTGSIKIEWFGNDLEVGEQYYKEFVDSCDIIDNMKNTLPTLLMYGDKDTTVPSETTLNCGEKLNAEVVKIKDADHGFGFYSGEEESGDQVVEAATKFFIEQLK